MAGNTNIENVTPIVQMYGLKTDKAADFDSTLNVQGAVTLQSTLAVTGAITATGGVVGAVTGNVTGDLTPAVESAEHGAGAIGTAATPTTTRWIESGVIKTPFVLMGARLLKPLMFQ